MSIITEAVGTVTGARWWRLAFKLAPWVAIAVLAIGLQLTRSTLARVRLEHKVELADREASAARATAAYADRVRQAADANTARTAALQPVIVHSRDTVRTYAETPPGRNLCLGAERAVGVQQDRSALFRAVAAGAPAVGADALPTGAPSSPNDGRDDQR